VINNPVARQRLRGPTLAVANALAPGRRHRLGRSDGQLGKCFVVAKGFAGTVFLTTVNCQASYEELRSRGVEFTEEPHEMPYGIDCGFRDPSGNSVRLTQLVEIPANTG
jgi:hypothetical protein